MPSTMLKAAFLSLILISANAKEDKATVKKLMDADISMTTKDALLNTPCLVANYCFFIGDHKVEPHVKYTKEDSACTEDFCLRVNFKPLNASCSKFEVFMAVINTDPEAMDPNATQWMGIGFKFRSNHMYDAYGLYCKEKSAALYYGFLQQKRVVDFSEEGEKVWTTKPSLISHPKNSDKQDGVFTCSFELLGLFNGIKEEPIDVASGNWNILLASGIKRTSGHNLQASPNDRDDDAVKFDKHTKRGTNKDSEKPAKAGGWGICPKIKVKSTASLPAINHHVFWPALLLLLLLTT